MSYPSRGIAYFVNTARSIGEIQRDSSTRIAGVEASKLKNVKKLQGLTHYGTI